MLLQSLIFIASFKTVCSVTNILFAFHGLYSKNAYKTCGKKNRSFVALESLLYFNNEMDDHLPLALLELDLSMS